MYAEADDVLKRLKVDVNSVYQRVESLSGGRQQSVAIARAISFEPRVVILDEPTANLSVMATERLLETMLELKKHGVAQIIISHRLQDIFAVGDRVMVLKRGENVGDRYIKHTTEQEVLGIIVSGTRDNGAHGRAGPRRGGLRGLGRQGRARHHSRAGEASAKPCRKGRLLARTGRGNALSSDRCRLPAGDCLAWSVSLPDRRARSRSDAIPW